MYPNINEIGNNRNDFDFYMLDQNLINNNTYNSSGNVKLYQQNNTNLNNKNISLEQYSKQFQNTQNISNNYNNIQITQSERTNKICNNENNSNKYVAQSFGININSNQNKPDNSNNNNLKINNNNSNLIGNKKELEKNNLNKNENFGSTMKNKLTEEEIEKAKENGYILIGKTGVGKTSLLNVIYGEKVGTVGYSSQSETKQSTFYCIKEKIGSDYIYFSIVDTPGLYDTNGKESDKRQKEQIMKLISESRIKVKGLLFLSNFQNERFDSSEQSCLLEYNAIFPLKEFWTRIIFIFTHYYGDPDGDSEEEIKKRAEVTLSNIIKIIMNKVKDVSNTVNFGQLNRKYVNIFSKAKNKKQLEKNSEVRKELINEIVKYNKFTPMFSKLQIFSFEKYQLVPGENKLYDLDFYIYLDANNNPVYEKHKINKTYEKTKDLLKEQKINVNIEGCEFDEEGNLLKKSTKKDFLMEVFDNYKGEGLTAISILGSIFTGIFCLPALPVCLIQLVGGLDFMKQKNEKENKKKQEINNFLLENNMIEMIRAKLYDKK